MMMSDDTNSSPTSTTVNNRRRNSKMKLQKKAKSARSLLENVEESLVTAIKTSMHRSLSNLDFNLFDHEGGAADDGFELWREESQHSDEEEGDDDDLEYQGKEKDFSPESDGMSDSHKSPTGVTEDISDSSTACVWPSPRATRLARRESLENSNLLQKKPIVDDENPREDNNHSSDEMDGYKIPGALQTRRSTTGRHRLMMRKSISLRGLEDIRDDPSSIRSARSTPGLLTKKSLSPTTTKPRRTMKKSRSLRGLEEDNNGDASPTATTRPRRTMKKSTSLRGLEEDINTDNATVISAPSLTKKSTSKTKSRRAMKKSTSLRGLDGINDDASTTKPRRTMKKSRSSRGLEDTAMEDQKPPSGIMKKSRSLCGLGDAQDGKTMSPPRSLRKSRSLRGLGDNTDDDVEMKKNSPTTSGRRGRLKSKGDLYKKFSMSAGSLGYNFSYDDIATPATKLPASPPTAAATRPRSKLKKSATFDNSVRPTSPSLKPSRKTLRKSVTFDSSKGSTLNLNTLYAPDKGDKDTPPKGTESMTKPAPSRTTKPKRKSLRKSVTFDESKNSYKMTTKDPVNPPSKKDITFDGATKKLACPPKKPQRRRRKSDSDTPLAQRVESCFPTDGTKPRRGLWMEAAMEGTTQIQPSGALAIQVPKRKSMQGRVEGLIKHGTKITGIPNLVDHSGRSAESGRTSVSSISMSSGLWGDEDYSSSRPSTFRRTQSSPRLGLIDEVEENDSSQKPCRWSNSINTSRDRTVSLQSDSSPAQPPKDSTVICAAPAETSWEQTILDIPNTPGSVQTTISEITMPSMAPLYAALVYTEEESEKPKKDQRPRMIRCHSIASISCGEEQAPSGVAFTKDNGAKDDAPRRPSRSRSGQLDCMALA